MTINTYVEDPETGNEEVLVDVESENDENPETPLELNLDGADVRQMPEDGAEQIFGKKSYFIYKNNQLLEDEDYMNLDRLVVEFPDGKKRYSSDKGSLVIQKYVAVCEREGTKIPEVLARTILATNDNILFSGKMRLFLKKLGMKVKDDIHYAGVAEGLLLGHDSKSHKVFVREAGYEYNYAMNNQLNDSLLEWSPKFRATVAKLGGIEDSDLIHLYK